jgi:hypothetical protein
MRAAQTKELPIFEDGAKIIYGGNARNIYQSIMVGSTKGRCLQYEFTNKDKVGFWAFRGGIYRKAGPFAGVDPSIRRKKASWTNHRDS